MNERQVKIYPRFERFWHWTQVVLILALLASGLRISGLYDGIPFGAAFILHLGAAVALMVLWIFAIFWHLTTGTWRHYVPTSNGLGKVARFYTYGIFKGKHHPYRKAYWRKHNPLQALAYLALKVVLFPAIWITGLLYLTYNLWGVDPGNAAWLPVVANLHILAAFAITAFIVAHVYLLTVGGSFRDHLRPMISGFDTVDLTPEEEAYLTADEPARLR